MAGARLIFALIGFALYGHLPTPFGLTTVLFIVGVTGVLALVDSRRRGEVDLFGNLGVSRTVMATLAASRLRSRLALRADIGDRA